MRALPPVWFFICAQGINALTPARNDVSTPTSQVQASSTDVLSSKDAGVVPAWIAVVFSGVIFAGIAFAYRGHGTKGVLHMMVYITSVIGCQLTMKYVLSAFPYPFFMSAVHFSITVSVVFAWKRWSSPQVQSSSFASYSPYWYATRIAPIGIALFGTVAANNASLLYIGAAMNSMLGIVTPVVTAMLASAFGLRIAFWAWIGITVALVGDTILTWDAISSVAQGGTAFWSSITGICLSFTAVGFRALKTVLQDYLMNKAYKSERAEPKVEPGELWVLQGPMVVGPALICTVTWDGFTPWLALLKMDAAVLSVMGLSCVCALYVNIGGMHMIKMLGAPAAQIAGKMNILVTTACASAFMGERLTPFEIFGTLVILLGAAMFERAQLADRDMHTDEGKPLVSMATKVQR